MTSASSGLVRSAVLPFGITQLTNLAAVPRTCGTWISSSPSAVCTCRGRFPFREPRASGVRSYRARPRNAVTSSSTDRCRTWRAPGRPISASRSPSPQSLGQQLLDGRLQGGARRYPRAHGVVLLQWFLRLAVEDYAVLLFQRDADAAAEVGQFEVPADRIPRSH